MTLRYHLRINQGETFRISFPVLNEDDTPVDSLSGVTVRAQIRSHAADAAVLHEFSLTDGASLDGNLVVLTVPAATSSAWSWRTARYDLEINDGTNTTRLAEGHVVVHPEITRP